MELGEVLSKAWKIIWKNKILWIFGILASCSQSGGGGGNGGSSFNTPGNNGNFNFENGNNPFSNGQFPGLEEFTRKFSSMFGAESQPQWGLILGLVCLIFFISLIFVFLGTIGRIGLIRGTMLADEGHEPLQFGQIWSASTPYFWKVFFLNLLFGLAISLALLILILPLVLLTVGTMGIGVLCMIPVICLLIPVIMVLNVIMEQANVALVVENLGIWDAVKRGWSICRGNLGPVAVVALVIIFGGGILTFIIGLPFILVALPMIFVLSSQDQTATATALSAMAVMLCCFTPIVIVLKGILQSYIGSAWTLTFLRLTKNLPADADHQAVSPMPE